VFVAEDAEEIDSLLGRALECASDPTFRKQVQEEAARHSWLQRAREIAGKL
jgi:hypothetical protein